MADSPLAPALRLAGFALAHAVASIDDGATLTTLALIERPDGGRELHRYAAPSLAESLDAAFGDLASALAGGGYAAVVFDRAVMPEDGERTDALVVDLFGRGAEALGRIVQPYRRARRPRMPFSKPRGFALLGPPRPGNSFDGDDADDLILEGAREHVEAAHHFPSG